MEIKKLLKEGILQAGFTGDILKDLGSGKGTTLGELLKEFINDSNPYFPYANLVLYGLLAYAGFKALTLATKGYNDSKKLATGRFAETLGEIEDKKGGYFKISKKHRINHKYMLESIGVIGPSGSAKTSSEILPNLLDTKLPPCSKIIFDPKKEIWNLTHRYRERLGEKCILFDPLGNSNVVYNPLEQCQDFQEVRELAEKMLNASITKTTDTTFLELSKPLLTSILYYAWHCGQNSLDTIITAIKMLNMPIDELDKLMDNCPELKVKEQYRFFKQAQGSAATTDCIKMSVANALQLYSDPILQRHICGKSTFNAKDVREEVTNVYITYEFSKADYLRPFLNIFLGQLLEKSCFSGAELPILFLIDEIQNIGRVPQLDKFLNVGRHYGMMIFAAMQNISKMYEIYGKNETKTILSALQTKVIFGGITDDDFLNYISNISGDREIVEYDSSTKKETKYTRKLMTQDEVRRIDKGECVIISHDAYFVRDKVHYYFQDEKYLDNALEGVEFYE